MLWKHGGSARHKEDPGEDRSPHCALPGLASLGARPQLLCRGVSALSSAFATHCVCRQVSRQLHLLRRAVCVHSLRVAALGPGQPEFDEAFINTRGNEMK